MTRTTVWLPIDARAPQRVEDLAAGRVVEVAGRLVGEQEGRPGDEGPGDGDALLLAGRQLVGLVAGLGAPRSTSSMTSRIAVAQLAPRRIGAGDGERQADVLGDIEQRDQVERLEDEPRPVAAQARGRLVGQLADGLALEDHRPFGRLVQAAEQLEQRRLAGARRPHQRQELALGDLERDAPQRLDRRLAQRVGLDEVARLEDGRHGGQCSRRVSRRRRSSSRHRRSSRAGPAAQRASTTRRPWRPQVSRVGRRRRGGERRRSWAGPPAPGPRVDGVVGRLDARLRARSGRRRGIDDAASASPWP